MAPAVRHSVLLRSLLLSLQQTVTDKDQLLPRKELSPGYKQNRIDARGKIEEKTTPYYLLFLN